MGEIIKLSTSFLESAGIGSSRLDAELLLAHALGMDRLQLYLEHDRPLEPSELGKVRELLRRRASREPLAWITGYKEFFSISFRVYPGVLVPRPETETLVEAFLRWADETRMPDPLFVADVGCGSGCVGLALAHELPTIKLYCTDLDPRALRCTRENAVSLGMKQRVALLHGDLLRPIPLERTLHWVVANPPYIRSSVLPGLQPEISRHEPRLALDGGEDGLDVIRRLLAQAARRVTTGVALEIGADQAEQAMDLARRAGFRRTALHRDLAGMPRVIVALTGSRSNGPTSSEVHSRNPL